MPAPGGRRSGPGPSRRGSAAGWPCWRARPALALLAGGGSLRPGRSRPAAVRRAPALGRRRRRWCACPGRGRPGMEYGIAVLFDALSYFEYNFSWTVHHYDKGNTLPSQFYTLAEHARDRAGEGQVAALDRRVLDHDRGAADRRWASAGGSSDARWAGPRNRSPGRDDLRGLRAGDAQERRRRDPGRAARALLLAGLCAGPAGGGRRDLAMAGLAGGRKRVAALAGRHVRARSSGQTRPGPTTRRGWSSRYQLHWPGLARAPASGSRPIPTGFRPRRGS